MLSAVHNCGRDLIVAVVCTSWPLLWIHRIKCTQIYNVVGLLMLGLNSQKGPQIATLILYSMFLKCVQNIDISCKIKSVTRFSIDLSCIFILKLSLMSCKGKTKDTRIQDQSRQFITIREGCRGTLLKLSPETAASVISTTIIHNIQSCPFWAGSMPTKRQMGWNEL